MPDEPQWVKGDVVRLAQVISNLLNNAAKYSDTNQPIVLTVEPSELWVTIRIKDNGIGIAPDLLPYVFDLFAQADHRTARTQGGLGIGLTLVKRLVEMHGGSAEAHSDGLGHGSVFLVRLPAQKAPLQMEARATPHDRVVGFEDPVRVLVVDDNEDAAESLALLMSFEGYKVAVAHDGAHALAEAERFRPLLVLLDIGMPGMDGYEVARALRARESSKSLVIVALTGYGQPEDRARSTAAGFTDHLTKPVVREKLIALVNRHLAYLQR